MDLELKSINIHLAQDFGKMGKKRIEKALEFLNSSSFQREKVPGGILLINQEEGERLVLRNQQITLQKEKAGESIDFENDIKRIILGLFDKLLLEDEVKGKAEFIYNIKDEESTFEISKRVFNQNNNNVLEEYNNFTGVGYRFLGEFEYGVSEFRVEPLIENDNFWHIENVFSFNEEVLIEDLFNLIEKNHNNFEQENGEFIKELIGR